ncbi:MAG: porin, partial [Pseudorhodoplanes sp.]
MKVCSLYGAGFYYIPGTDTCIKIGGFVRTEWNHNANGSFSPYVSGAEALFTRNTNTLRNRTRIVTSFDVRSQTEYGTLRAYARAGWQWTSQDPTFGGSSGTVYLDRAFIQFAGFTFGKTQSFFDFFCTGCYSLSTNLLWGDTGGSGTPVAAYTAQFGNGVSATLSIE